VTTSATDTSGRRAVTIETKNAVARYPPVTGGLQNKGIGTTPHRMFLWRLFMGNFDPLFAEIRRRRRNRWVLGALAINWMTFVLVLHAPLGLQA
jgi:hypothetical protein